MSDDTQAKMKNGGSIEIGPDGAQVWRGPDAPVLAFNDVDRQRLLGARWRDLVDGEVIPNVVHWIFSDHDNGSGDSTSDPKHVTCPSCRVDVQAKNRAVMAAAIDLPERIVFGGAEQEYVTPIIRRPIPSAGRCGDCGRSVPWIASGSACPHCEDCASIARLARRAGATSWGPCLRHWHLRQAARRRWIGRILALVIAAAALALFAAGCGEITSDEAPDGLVRGRPDVAAASGTGGAGVGGGIDGAGGARAAGTGGAATFGTGGAGLAGAPGGPGTGGALAAGGGGANAAGGTAGAAAPPPARCSTPLKVMPPAACPGGTSRDGLPCFSCEFGTGTPDVDRDCARSSGTVSCDAHGCTAHVDQLCVLDCGSCS